MDYNRYSPWRNTPQSTWYLDIYNPISIPLADDDEIYTIPTQYHQQPMALAKLKYNSERLFYVFAIVNPNLKDPIYDFTQGTVIRVPTSARIQKIFGGK